MTSVTVTFDIDNDAHLFETLGEIQRTLSEDLVNVSNVNVQVNTTKPAFAFANIFTRAVDAIVDEAKVNPDDLRNIFKGFNV